MEKKQVRKILVIKTDVGEFPVVCKERTFKTGSKGYGLYAKVIFEGKRYQLVGNLIEIGSKQTQ
ncbi:MAG: hypothetical protein QXK24_00070 [Ignisphaera sp.]